MPQTGKDNPEYMAVLTEVVDCLYQQLHDPRLAKPTAAELHRWLANTKLDEIESALSRLQDRAPVGDKPADGELQRQADAAG